MCQGNVLKALSKEKDWISARGLVNKMKVSYASVQRALKVLRKSKDVKWKQSKTFQAYSQYLYRIA